MVVPLLFLAVCLLEDIEQSSSVTKIKCAHTIISLLRMSSSGDHGFILFDTCIRPEEVGYTIRGKLFLKQHVEKRKATWLSTVLRVYVYHLLQTTNRLNLDLFAISKHDLHSFVIFFLIFST